MLVPEEFLIWFMAAAASNTMRPRFSMHHISIRLLPVIHNKEKSISSHVYFIFNGRNVPFEKYDQQKNMVMSVRDNALSHTRKKQPRSITCLSHKIRTLVNRESRVIGILRSYVTY